MIGRENKKFDIPENRKREKFPARSLLVPVLFTLISLASLLIVVTFFSGNAQAAYGVQVNVQPPKDKYMNTSSIPQSVIFDINVENTGTSMENVNLTVTFDDPLKPAAGWTVNPINFTVNNLGVGAIEIRQITVTAPVAEPAYSFAQLTVLATVQEDPSQISQDNFIARVSPIFDVSLSTGDNSNSVPPGNSTDYYIKVKNKGSQFDDFTASFWAEDPIASTWSSVSPSSFGLFSGENITIMLTVDVPAGTSPGNYNIWINVTSDNDSAATDSLLTFTNVYAIYSFELSTTAPLNTKKGEPGDSISFILQVKNTGTTVDSFEFRVTSVDGAVFTVPDPNMISNIAVDTYGTTTAVVTITSDKSKALVGSYQIAITANSMADPGVYQVINLIVEITPVAAVEITPVSMVDSGLPGEVINYTFKITNKGNAQDTFDLTLAGSYKDWGEILDGGGNPITQVTLNANSLPGSFTNIILRVTIPSSGEARAGQTYLITIIASSRNVESVSDTAQGSTTVENYLELVLEYSGSGSPQKDYDPNKLPPKFRLKVTNNGNQDESGVEVRMDNIDPDWGYTPNIILETLGPEETTTFSLEFTIPLDESEGEYEMWVYLISSVDPSVESDPMLITVNITKPDLSVSTSEIFGLDDLAYLKSKVGESVTVTARVKNEGHSTAEMVQVKFYEDDSVSETKTISSIDAGSFKDVDFVWFVVAEEVDIKVEITPIIEINVDNNAISPIFLDLRPDLSFEGEELNFSNPNPPAGEIIIISAFVVNNGGNVEDVVVEFYEVTEIIGTDTLDIGYGDIGEAKFEWEVPDTPGESITLKAKINLTDAKGDDEETIKSIKVAEEEVILHAPVLNTIGHLIATEDETFSYTVTAVDIDPGDTLTFFDDTDLFDINSTFGNITFLPSNDDVGIHVVKIMVIDSYGATDSENVIFTVNNVNDPPIIASIDHQTLTEDIMFTLAVTAADIDIGETLTFSCNTTLFDINPLSGVISFTPKNKDVGTYLINISVKDKSGNIAYRSVAFTVNNVNDPPTINYIGELTILEGRAFSYTVMATDIDYGDSLTFSDGTELFDIDPSTGEISFTPTEKDIGVHLVTIMVTDGNGETDQTTVKFTVLGAESEPSELSNFTWILWAIIIGLIMFFIGYLLGGKRKVESPEEEKEEPGYLPPPPLPPPGKLETVEFETTEEGIESKEG